MVKMHVRFYIIKVKMYVHFYIIKVMKKTVCKVRKKYSASALHGGRVSIQQTKGIRKVSFSKTKGAVQHAAAKERFGWEISDKLTNKNH